MPEYARIRGSRRQLWIGAAVLFALSAAANLASPLYPHFKFAYAMTDWTMTALYATYVISCLPALLLFGSAADAFGRKPVLLAAIGSVSVGTALFTVDTIGVSGLFAGRVLTGVGLGLGTGAGIALMVEASPARRAWLGSTAATMSFVLGTGAGPIIAGVVSEMTAGPTSGTTSLVAPFWVMLALLIVTGLLVITLRFHSPMTRQRWRPTWPSVPGPMRSSFYIAAVTGLLGWALLGLFLALLPSMTETTLPESSTLTSGLIVGTVLVISAASQLLAPKLQPRAAQTIGLTLLGLGAALLLSSNLPSLGAATALVLMTTAAVATGTGHGLSYWGANREIDMLTPSRHRAGITAALYLAFYTGAGLPAIVVGAIAIGTSLIDAIMIFTLVLLLAVIVFIPVPSLALTTVRRSRAEAAAAREADRHSGHTPGVTAPQDEPAAHLTEEPSAPFSFEEDYHSNGGVSATDPRTPL
ncbi:MFS transporter [Brevibacterium sp. UCMA 11754]|uniref:MFS transporter n=1 Tax=Brevibacterium sp. UCMA 11754 TaxID=2749198 RepID=UPI001F20A94A|nr:MFS transporter [Brevibacterium sp. UCMA 11754]MCF2571240.1 MFS transporter [Brevibacterium sp. UCMA 11754]